MKLPELPGLPALEAATERTEVWELMTAYAPSYGAAVREECARVCENSPVAKVATLGDWTKLIGAELAAAIREEGD